MESNVFRLCLIFRASTSLVSVRTKVEYRHAQISLRSGLAYAIKPRSKLIKVVVVLHFVATLKVISSQKSRR